MILDRRRFLQGVGVSMLLPSVLQAAERRLDVAYVNCTVWSGVRGAPMMTAFGTIGNRITAVGGEEVRATTHAKTRIVDLEGAFVTPGIIDPHTHLLMAADALTSVNLRQAATPKKLTSVLGAYANTKAKGTWIVSGNWDEQLWGGELPTRHWIDSATANNPVAVTRLDLHMTLANSLALKLAGVDRNTPDPAGGVIVRDKNGEPTGILKDKAQALIQAAIPPLTEAEIEIKLKACIEHALSLGVTQIHTKALDWLSHDALRRLRTKGETDVRFNSFVPLQDWEKLHTLIREEGRGDEWVRWGGLKGLVDGSLGSGTALFYEDYSDEPGHKGISYAPLADLREQILAADRHGLQIAVHAIGDRANDEALDMFANAVQKNRLRDRRFIIEHAQHLKPSSISRFKELEVIASMQPYHAIDDGRWAVKRIGQQRLHGTYAFKSLIDAGVHVGFGSDWPVAPLDPRSGIQAAVLRQTLDGANPNGWQPSEKVTVEMALEAYTATNAYAGYQENTLGKIAPGYLADFVVFANNLTTIDPQTLHKTNILKTVVNGEVRYEK